MDVNQFNDIYTREIARLVANDIAQQLTLIDNPVKLANLINGPQVKRINWRIESQLPRPKGRSFEKSMLG